MRIAKDGHLCLQPVDLKEDKKEAEPANLNHFKLEAQIAVAYALAAGYRVSYDSGLGLLIEEMIVENCWYWVDRKKKRYARC